MKIGVNIINAYLKNPVSTQDMVDAFEQTEVEVEEILYANQLDSKVIVAKVVKVEPHPNADRLKLVTVSTDGGKRQIVCGAPNVRKDLTVAFAQVGTVLPDGTEIQKASIRGVNSEGMLCSERELGWGEDHSGIVELNPQFPLGKSLCDIENYGDVLDIKTPSNRWDYLSNIGLAREIAAVTPKNELIEPTIGEYTYQNREVANVKKKESCPAIYLVKVAVKDFTHSPQWVVDNLEAGGIRPINPVVDITNLVMLEYGQPSHAYDAKKLTGKLQVRFAKKAESLTTLDGKTHKLVEDDLIIADDSGPLGLAGVMGGEKTEIGPNTTEILLEVANFDKTIVRRTSLRHGLRTEASNRFEKGLPLPLPHLATKRLLDLFKEICNAEILDGPFEQTYAHVDNPWLGMRLRKAEAFLGYKLEERTVVEGLKKRGFNPEHFSFSSEIQKYLHKPYKFGANNWSDGLEAFDCSYLTQTILGKAAVVLPRIATDQFDEGVEVKLTEIKPGDLIFIEGEFENEKAKTEHRGIGHVGMFVGKDKVLQASSRLGKVAFSPLSLFTKAKEFKGVRRYTESFNHIISVEVPWWRNDISSEVDLFEETAKIVGYDAMPETLPQLPPMSMSKDFETLPRLMDLRNMFSARGMQEVMTYSFVSQKDVETIHSSTDKHLQIENPLSSEQDFLRTGLLSSHLHAAASNAKRHPEALIYEISRVYEYRSKKQDKVSEKWVLGITTWGSQNFDYLKGAMDVLSDHFKTVFDFERTEDINMIIGRTGRTLVKNLEIGLFGQVRPNVARQFGVKTEVSFAQIELQPLLDFNDISLIKPALPYGLVERDLTIELNQMATWQEVIDSLQTQKNLRNIEFVNEFESEELTKQNKKRIHFRLKFDLGPNPQGKEIELVLNKSQLAITHAKTLGPVQFI